MQKVIQMTEEEYNSLLTNAPSGVLEMTNSKLKNKLDVALSTLKELEDKLLQYELVKTNIVHKESKAKELTEEELNDLIKIIIYTSESII
jgi:sugar-specific transcriptional regulator TrmB